MSSSPASGVDRPALLPALAVGLGAAMLVIAWVTATRWNTYWNFSEGVYAMTSRELIHGQDLYRGVVVAQPPNMFLVGGAALLVSDTLGGLRIAMDLFQLGGGLLAALAVWRMTGSRWLAAAMVPIAVALPWAVHEQGTLTPEVVVLPLLMGAAVLVARPRTAVIGGVLLALACFTKVPYLIPAVLVTIAVRTRWRVLLGLSVGLAVQALAGWLVFGDGLWNDAIVAQLQSRHRPVPVMLRIAEQAGWNLAGLLAGVVLLLIVFVARRRRDTDPDQLRASFALALGLGLTFASVLKKGTDLNILVPIELSLLPVAAVGWWSAWGAGRARAATITIRATVVALVGLTVVQGPSLAVAPVREALFRRPGGGNVSGFQRRTFAWGRYLGSGQVGAIVARARTCPAGEPWGGAPFFAFLADRRMPAGQPDLYIISQVRYHRRTLARVRADQPWCTATGLRLGGAALNPRAPGAR